MVDLPLRLVRLISWLPVGGVEKRLVATLTQMDRSLFQPEVVCLRERGELADSLEAEGIPVHVIPFSSRFSPTCMLRLARHLRGAQIVHGHMYRGNLRASLAGRMAKVPVIVGHLHNVDSWERPNQVRWEGRAARWRDLTICVSDAVRLNAISALGVHPEMFHTIHNGINLKGFETPFDRSAMRESLGLKPDEVALVCSARLHPVKNHVGLLSVLAEIPDDLPPWKLLVVGEGSMRDQIEEQIQALNLTDRVTLLGQRRDIPDVLRACDLGVLFSEREGFSNAVLECFAAGLPMIASEVGGNAEAITEGVCGHLVPSGDTEALRECLTALISDAEQRRTMGGAARERAKEFSLEEMILKTEALYLGLLSQKMGERFPQALRDALSTRIRGSAHPVEP